MNYKLNITTASRKKTSLKAAIKTLTPLLAGEKRNLIFAFAAILVSAASTLFAPIIISHVIDKFIPVRDYHGVLVYSGILLAVFAAGLASSYIQTLSMGFVGRKVLFNLRNAIFTKLQELPVAFFNQNKAGDLISRINNDTDKLNQFFSQALMQFIGSFFLIAGAGIFVIVLNFRLGAASLAPALLVLVVTQIISAWVKRRNTRSLQTLGSLSSEVQESLVNFKVIVAFNRLDYFRQKFGQVNQNNYETSVDAGIANNIFTPLYGLASNLAQLTVIAYGIYLIMGGHLTIGLLIGFLLYVNNFYNPLRQLANVWSTLQLALAAFDRVSEVLALESDMPMVVDEIASEAGDDVLAFQNVSFHYPDGKDVLRDINFTLKRGKTYALVGPTGGGKTTTASLMARLYDPTSGKVEFLGRDIRSYSPRERGDGIGFILQEPFLFTGTVRDNLLYGNHEYVDFSNDQLNAVLEQDGLSKLLSRFTDGLDTEVTVSGNSISLGQKQLIAFMRAFLRKPKLLILDEATANVDTVTEQLLEEILTKLPKDTTKVIIAHRLNTIKRADQIFFINAGEITPAGSMEHAVEMLLSGQRQS
ncbi:MAG TPA: ABC transporter ATP-binding protein [Patescibacteria group bacterium]|nr:ABC transporter ATP-binding protein [Patescibacteria group bacterium]